ncbi:MAG: DNA adenine methylase [Pseudomonadota bacterium]|nr:DNA adenine methylase [Pseudomonadota bacterium]
MKKQENKTLSRPLPRPFIKWAGGKRQLLPVLQNAMPVTYTGRYFEPFIGGGALFFALQPHRATISDTNTELINAYQVIRDELHALLDRLKQHLNNADYFYAIRACNVSQLTPLERASRFIFLNKTCFNGLHRVNSKGLFNVPFGRYTNPSIVDENNLRAVSHYLNNADIQIKCQDYQSVLDLANAGDFVYFDPPYAPLSKTASFAGYAQRGFGLKDQTELADVFTRLTAKGVAAMLSNSNTPVIHELYQGFSIQTVHATRTINSNGAKRGKAANEVLVTNY